MMLVEDRSKNALTRTNLSPLPCPAPLYPQRFQPSISQVRTSVLSSPTVQVFLHRVLLRYEPPSSAVPPPRQLPSSCRIGICLLASVLDRGSLALQSIKGRLGVGGIERSPPWTYRVHCVHSPVGRY